MLIGVDDGTIQVAHLFTSASYAPSESDEEHNASALEEVRSLSERPSSRLSFEEPEVLIDESKEEVDGLVAEEPAPPPPEDDLWDYFKKKSKKSKLASRRGHL